ncbi:AAA family ATPase [Pseudoalteromonas shioyasakiensis]|uniref:AAA family ATPase n=1 Tax=Pseudoalteromonas shioyasakiensis TaxID=1190813 RepID=UPI002117853A|nr:AAA family ATPase [Pseudoalteromonas shioyasakiensis]MCQ8877596.1 AAA family ATPase [Pseudoalteromonas shioyasakiensis]
MNDTLLDNQSQHTSPPYSVSLSESVFDILYADIEPPKVIIPNMLIEGEATMLAAHAGGAKTFISQYIAACVSTGSGCFGAPPSSPLNVLYIDGELSAYQIQQRFRAIFSDLGYATPTHTLQIMHKQHLQQVGALPDLATANGFSSIATDINNADVVIIDNLSALCPSADEMTQNAWNIYNHTIDTMRHAGKAVLILHHTDKNGISYRGHSEIARAVDNVIIAKKDTTLSTHNKTVIDLKKTKSRNAPSRETFMSITFGDLRYDGGFSMQYRL